MEPPDERPRPSIEGVQVDRLARALSAWASRHPEPDRPIFGFGNGQFASPRELAAAVESGSDLGRQFAESVSLTLEEISFEAYVKSIERSGYPRSRLLRWLLEQLSAAWLSRRIRPERSPVESR